MTAWQLTPGMDVTTLCAAAAPPCARFRYVMDTDMAETDRASGEQGESCESAGCVAHAVALGKHARPASRARTGAASVRARTAATSGPRCRRSLHRLFGAGCSEAALLTCRPLQCARRPLQLPPSLLSPPLPPGDAAARPHSSRARKRIARHPLLLSHISPLQAERDWLASPGSAAYCHCRLPPAGAHDVGWTSARFQSAVSDITHIQKQLLLSNDCKGSERIWDVQSK